MSMAVVLIIGFVLGFAAAVAMLFVAALLSR